MTWFKVDDSFAQHPKVLAIPRKDRPAAVGLWTLAGTWCAAQLTDGHLAAYLVAEFGSTVKLAEQLVRVGLWEATDGGYRFHDWADWQPTRDQVEGERAAARERMQRARERRRRSGEQPPQFAGSSPEHTPNDERTSPEVHGSSPGVRLTPTRPDPTRPDPNTFGVLNGSPREGDVEQVDARASNAPPPPEPPLCRRHAGWDRDAVPPCAPCGRLREAWEQQIAAADQPPPKPPWCGDCDPDTRLLEVGDHEVARCPVCHPALVHLATTGAHP
jgi:hypothetical protein